jgi:hypothetical protein
MLFALGRRLSSGLTIGPLSNVAFCGVLLAYVGCGGAEPQGELPPVEDLANVQQASVDCTQWTDTGYTNGTPFEITLVTIDGKPAEVKTANAYIVMQEAAAAAGVSIKVVSGFRTNAEQQYLYDCYQGQVNCANCNNCNQAAPPGYSNHQSGHALDLNTSTGSVLTWLNAHGAAYGFEATVAGEDWHWEWWGGGPGGGPCNDTTPPTPCTVTTTGKSGECMDTSACAALGNHESTPGYCPGPTNIQCCTATTPPPVDAAAEVGEPTPDAGPAEDAGLAKDAGVDTDAGVAKDGGVTKDAGPGKDASGFYAENSDSTGGCRIATGGSDRAASQWPFAALFAALFVAFSTRRRVLKGRFHA